MENTGENKKIAETNQCSLRDELILEKFEAFKTQMAELKNSRLQQKVDDLPAMPCQNQTSTSSMDGKLSFNKPFIGKSREQALEQQFTELKCELEGTRIERDEAQSCAIQFLEEKRVLASEKEVLESRLTEFLHKKGSTLKAQNNNYGMENFAPRGSPHFHSSPSLLPRIDEEDPSFSESDQSYDPIVCAEVDDGHGSHLSVLVEEVLCMSTAMQREAIGSAKTALENNRSDEYGLIARHIKHHFDLKFGAEWKCIVSDLNSCCGWSIADNPIHLIDFRIGELRVALLK